MPSKMDLQVNLSDSHELKFHAPLVASTYSHNNELVYFLTADGTVIERDLVDENYKETCQLQHFFGKALDLLVDYRGQIFLLTDQGLFVYSHPNYKNERVLMKTIMKDTQEEERCKFMEI